MKLQKHENGTRHFKDIPLAPQKNKSRTPIKFHPPTHQKELMVEAQEFEYWRIGSILREGEFVGSVGFLYLLSEEFQSFPSKRRRGRRLFYPWNPIYCVLRSFSSPQQQAPPQLPLINEAERIRNSWGKIYREGDSPILDKNCYFLEV